MNVISLFTEGVKKVFNGDWCKHICLFAITGLLSAVTLMFEGIKEGSYAPNLVQILFGLVVFVVVSMYLCGYGFSFMHNCFGEKGIAEEKDVMPEISGEHFGVFFGALLLILAWILMYGFAGILIMILVAFTRSAWLIIPVALLLAFAGIFIQFIYIAYSKHFNPSGLCNIGLPFVYMRHAFWDVALLGLLYFVLYIIFGILLFVFGVMSGFAGIDGSASSYIGGLIGGYWGFVFQLVWCYCCVQIYKEKIELEIDSEY